MKTYEKNRIRIKKYLRALAGTLDMIVFTVLATAGFIRLIRGDSDRIVIMILVASAILLIVILSDRIAKKRKTKRLYEEIEQTVCREKVLLMTDREIANAVQANNIVFIRKEHPDKGEILTALSEQPEILIVLKADPEIRMYLDLYAPHTHVTDAADLCRQIGIVCTREETERRLRAIETDRLVHPLGALIKNVPLNRYLMLGTLLLVLSFIVPYKIYYRLLSSACLFLSVIQGVFKGQMRANILRFFLDNTDRR